MELADLLVSFKQFRARKVKGEMVVRKSAKGLYKARNALDVRNILTDGWSLLPVYVRLNKKKENWIEITPTSKLVI